MFTCLHVDSASDWILDNGQYLIVISLFKQKSYYYNNKKCKILQIG